MSQNNPLPKINPEKGDGQKKGPKFTIYWIYAIIAIVLLSMQFLRMSPDLAPTSQQEYFDQMLIPGDVQKIDIVKNKERVRVYIKPDRLSKDFYITKFKKDLSKEKGKVQNVPLFEFELTGDVKNFKDDLKEIYAAHPELARVPEKAVTDAEWTGPIFNTILSLLFIIGAWVLLMRKMGGGGPGGGGPGGIFNIGKSKATLFDKGAKVNITFADVAGLDEAKVEVMEIVDFLKQPKKYTSLGGKIPKGALLVGPPGTGKTLLAKAMAGEAQVPFFSLSGSDFVEMFVGVGASRVRDMFEQAKKQSPCIIFIDEIEVILKKRSDHSHGNNEDAKIVNAFLQIMDGFETKRDILFI